MKKRYLSSCVSFIFCKIYDCLIDESEFSSIGTSAKFRSVLL